MALRSVMGSSMRSVMASGMGGRAAAAPAKRAAAIALAAGGALYDPSDVTSLYQSRTGGSTGANGQPVGIMLDKSYMGGASAAAFIAAQASVALGTMVDASSAPGTATYLSGTLTLDAPSGGTARGRFPITTVSGSWYRVTCSRSGGTTDCTLDVGTSAGGNQLVPNTTVTASTVVLFRATSTTTWLNFYRGAVNTSVVTSISVKAIPSFHALAPADNQRPTLHADGYLDFDGVNDLLNAVVTNLGSNVSVYHRTQAGSHVWLTGQTIGAGNYALSTTDWRKAAIIPGGVTAGQQATIEAWGAS